MSVSSTSLRATPKEDSIVRTKRLLKSSSKNCQVHRILHNTHRTLGALLFEGNSTSESFEQEYIHPTPGSPPNPPGLSLKSDFCNASHFLGAWHTELRRQTASGTACSKGVASSKKRSTLNSQWQKTLLKKMSNNKNLRKTGAGQEVSKLMTFMGNYQSQQYPEISDNMTL